VGGLLLLIVGLGGVVVVMGVIWLTSVIRSRGVTGSRGGGMVISTHEAAKVASTNQFFYFILECFAFFCSVAMVAVVTAIFAHVGVGGCGCLAWWRDEIGLEGFVQNAGTGYCKGGISGEARLAGFVWTGIRAWVRLCGGVGGGCCVVVAEFGVKRLHFLHADVVGCT